MEWDTLERLVDKLALGIDEDKLYQDFAVLKDVFEGIPEELAPSKKSNGLFFFKKEKAPIELLKVVTVVLSVPISNAYAERVLSHMEGIWSDKRSGMSVGLVKAELRVRLNRSCLEFTAFIEGQQGLLQAAKGMG